MIFLTFTHFFTYIYVWWCNMKNICVIFGGKSVENEVSVITAKQVIQNFDYSKYKLYPVYIDKQGKFWTGNNFDDVKIFNNFNPKKHKSITFQGGSGGFFIKRKFVKIDCAVVCCHGTGGEDGSLQGLLNMAEIPYTSCGVEASAICMNKITMKKMFEYLSLPVTKYITLNKEQYKNLTVNDVKLDYPLFVKPANLGSSVGINKCNNFNQVKQALEIAFHFDNKVIIEQGVQNLIEYNCSAMNINGKVVASQIEQPHAWSEFLNFDDKYIKKGKKFAKKVKKVNIGKRLEQKIKQMTVFTYEQLNMKGVVRTDYLYDKTNKKLYINEVNTIPGSLAYYLWKSHNLSFKDIIDNLITQALQDCENNKQISTSYKSSIFDKYLKE